MIQSLLKSMCIPVYDNNCYYIDGNKVPRVTAILSRCIHSDAITGWANYLGFKRLSYNRVLKEAEEIGSCCHNAIDQYCNNGSYEMDVDEVPIESYNAYNGFIKWYTELCHHNPVKMLYHEYTLICEYFGGTMDAMIEINGKVYIVDYKTSNHVQFKHFLQLAAYRYMARLLLNIEVDGCIILQLNKKNTGEPYNEYRLDFSNPEHLDYINQCEQTFLALVYAYYNMENTEHGFNKIFPKEKK